MSLAAKKETKLTAKEYRAFERTAEVRHEFFDGEMFAMSGGSMPRSQIITSLAGEIGCEVPLGLIYERTGLLPEA